MRVKTQTESKQKTYCIKSSKNNKNNSEKRVIKSIYCVYFSSHWFNFIQHDFHEQHTNTQISKYESEWNTQTHTSTHTFLTTRVPLTLTQSRILSDPQLHQQRTKSRLKRVKSCSILFKISFLSGNNWTSSPSSHFFYIFRAHTQTFTVAKHSHIEERIRSLKREREMTGGSNLSSLIPTQTLITEVFVFFNFSFRFQSVAIFTIFAPIF